MLSSDLQAAKTKIAKVQEAAAAERSKKVAAVASFVSPMQPPTAPKAGHPIKKPSCTVKAMTYLWFTVV